MSAAPTSQPSLESLSCNICFIVWELVIEIGQNMLGMIICWMPAMLLEDSKCLEYFTLDKQKKSPTLYFSGNCCGVRLSRRPCNTVGRCIWQHDLKLYSSSDPWPALCSDKKGICILTDNSGSTWCCNTVRSCSLVPYLLIHGIVYKDSLDYLLFAFHELKNYCCSSCLSDSIFWNSSK